MSFLQNFGKDMPLWKKMMAFAGLLALCAALWFCFFRADEYTVIRNRVQNAAKLLAFQSNAKGNTVQTFADANSIGEFVMPNASVAVNLHALPGAYDFVLNNRAEAVSAYAACRAGCADLTCEVSDFSVEFLNDEHTQAKVCFIASGKGRLNGGNEFRDFRYVTSVMQIDPECGKWRFSELKADYVESLNESSLIPAEL